MLISIVTNFFLMRVLKDKKIILNFSANYIGDILDTFQ
jgi:hypothetical protein